MISMNFDLLSSQLVEKYSVRLKHQATLFCFFGKTNRQMKQDEKRTKQTTTEKYVDIFFLANPKFQGCHDESY